MTEKESARTIEDQTLEILYNLKHRLNEPRAHGIIPVWMEETLTANLRVLTTADLERNDIITDLANWRDTHSHWFLAQFKVTIEGTKRWFDQGVLENKDRILFLLEDSGGTPIGHMGFYRFNFPKYYCEVDNVVRGRDCRPGLMTAALRSMMRWGFGNLPIKEYKLRTYAENVKAVSLYQRCGFVSDHTVPMVKKIVEDRTEWIPIPSEKKADAERFELEMKYKPNFHFGDD